MVFLIENRAMKRTPFLLALLVAVLPALLATPQALYAQSVSIQGRLTTPEGMPVSDGTYEVTENTTYDSMMGQANTDGFVCDRTGYILPSKVEVCRLTHRRCKGADYES